MIDLGLLEKELVGRSKKYRYRLTFYDVTSKQVWEMQSNGIQDEEIHRIMNNPTKLQLGFSPIRLGLYECNYHLRPKTDAKIHQKITLKRTYLRQAPAVLFLENRIHFNAGNSKDI